MILRSALGFCLIKAVKKSKVIIWLYDNIEMRIEGKIIVCIFNYSIVRADDSTL